jgi:Fic family protein
MDKAPFTDTATGKLVAIEDGHKFAFIPDGLPDQWAPSGQLINLWGRAHDILGELRGTGHALTDHALLIRPLRQREALRSSSLEGTYATPEELLAYELNPRDPDTAEDPANTWREVFNYQRSLELGQKLVEDGYPFSEWLVRQLHEQLLVGVRGADKSPGKIRDTQVHIGVGHRFTPAPPEHVGSLMGQLEQEMAKHVEMDPLIKALMIHYQFETIHPFRDGNGRVGRLLLALMIYKDCGFDLPWLYLSEYFEKHRDEYIDALFNVSARGDWDRWIGLGLNATIEVGKSTIKRILGLLGLKKKYEDLIKGYDGRDRLIFLIPDLLSSPIIKYRDLETKLGITYPTARADMDALLEMGIVKELGGGKSPKRFYAHEIFHLAYFDDD